MLLRRLSIPFDCISPEIDETPLGNEAPADYVVRMAIEKASKVASNEPQAIVIGSDQTALFEGQVIGKPGDFKQAVAQLTAFSGQEVDFLTAVTVVNPQQGFAQSHTDTTRVSFRQLQREEIERYLHKEQPFDCAGSFKVESLGVTLFTAVRSTDPTAIIGLPLIETAAMLRQAGIMLP